MILCDWSFAWMHLSCCGTSAWVSSKQSCWMLPSKFGISFVSLRDVKIDRTVPVKRIPFCKAAHQAFQLFPSQKPTFMILLSKSKSTKQTGMMFVHCLCCLVFVVGKECVYGLEHYTWLQIATLAGDTVCLVQKDEIIKEPMISPSKHITSHKLFLVSCTHLRQCCFIVLVQESKWLFLTWSQCNWTMLGFSQYLAES